MNSAIKKIKQSEYLFQREYLDGFYFHPESIPYNADKFIGYRYEIYIPLIIGEGNAPEFNSITIKNISPEGQSKIAVITADNRKEKSHYKDRARLGALIFLLAAKMKYDLLCEKLDGHKSGFLYTGEHVRLLKSKKTDISPSVLS